MGKDSVTVARLQLYEIKKTIFVVIGLYIYGLKRL